MSMRYYAVNDYGLVLSPEDCALIASKVFDFYNECEDEDWGYLLYDRGICEYDSEFTGEAVKISDSGSELWGNSNSYDNDSIYYASLHYFPTLFTSAYNNMDEVVEELKERLGEYLPDDFDYRSRIAHIIGTYYG